jgi:hypothetical protein
MTASLIPRSFPGDSEAWQGVGAMNYLHSISQLRKLRPRKRATSRGPSEVWVSHPGLSPSQEGSRLQCHVLCAKGSTRPRPASFWGLLVGQGRDFAWRAPHPHPFVFPQGLGRSAAGYKNLLEFGNLGPQLPPHVPLRPRKAKARAPPPDSTPAGTI